MKVMMIQEKREKGSRYEIQLITTETKDEVNCVQNQNNSYRERWRTKRENTMNGRTKENHERKG
jgi:hypothetical protein